MTTNKKILLCSVYKRNKNDIYDYFEANTSNRFFKFSMPRIQSFGLRFIKQNLPEVEIIEFPMWNEYVDKIKEKDWDVVGFSFYLNEISEILEMVKYARENLDCEIWAGNYGGLTEEIKKYFDKIFIGYSEDQIAKELGKNFEYDELIHPPLIGYTSSPIGVKLNCQGYLFTNRGCNHKCDFCQTPAFCKKPYKIPLKSIEKVLKYYRSLGISEVIILDESFGCFKSHAEDVVNLLDKYGFFWFPMLRADYLNKRLDDWVKKGLLGVLIGVENINQEVLDKLSRFKKTRICSNQNNNLFIGDYRCDFRSWLDFIIAVSHKN